MMFRLYISFLLLCVCFNAAGQPGKPDFSFGKKAWIKAPYFQGNYFSEGAAAVLPQPDGAQYVLLISTRTLLVHLKKDGTLDAAYGINGYSASVNIQSAKAVQQTDGKIVVAGSAYIGATAGFALARFNTDGTLDKTFGKDGTLYIDFEEQNGHLEGVVLQADGKIVVGGNMLEGEGDDFAGAMLARLLENGSPDASFDTDGKLDLNYMRIGAVAAQPDGKLLIGGSAQQSAGSDFALARFLNNGAPDSTFGNAGRLTTDVMNGDDGALALAVDENNKILAAGFAGKKGAGQYDFALVRYNANGAMDNSFDGNGKLVTDFGGTETARFIALQNGKIILGGIQAPTNSSNTNFALARYTAGGTLDKTFNAGGKLITDFFGTADEPASLAIGHNGEIMFSGFAYNDSVFNLDYALASYTSNGAPNAAFGHNGKFTGHIPAGDALFSGLCVQPDGKVLAVVNRNPFALQGPSDFVVARFNGDGTPDAAFGENGQATTDFFGRNDFAGAITLLPDGRFIVAGTVRNNTTDLDEFGLARYFADGTPDTSFGIGGKTTTGVPSGSAAAVAVAQDKNGNIIVAGTVYRLVSDYNFMVARYSPGGVLDKAFGDAGISITNITEGWAFARSLAVQPDDKIIVAGIAGTQNSGYDFALVRYNPDGLPDPSFGGDGKVVADFSGSDDHANAVAIQKDGKIVVAGASAISGTGFDLTLAGFNPDGTFNNSFGNSGKVNYNFPASSAVASAITVQENGQIIVAGNSYNAATGTETDIVLGRFGADGWPDSSFGTNGFVVSDFEGDEQAASVAVWGNRIYVGGASRLIEREALLAAYQLGSNTVSHFVLVDAAADTALYRLGDKTIIDLKSIAGKSINIQANTAPYNVGSVVFALRGRQWHNTTENTAPYALFGNRGRAYKSWKPAAGKYTLTATPYAGVNGTGAAGTPLSIHFEVKDTPALTHFTLVDAITNKDIRTLQNGDVINLSISSQINIRANRQTLTVESVRFGVNGNSHYSLQNTTPFALASDNGGDYAAWRVAPGSYTITATPYSQNNATGEAGTPISVRFEVISGAGTPCVTPDFTNLHTFQTNGTGAYTIAVDDYDGNGKPDMAVSINGKAPNHQGSVSVLLNNGAGRFETAVGYSSGGQNTTSVTTGDFNGDGKPDLAVTNHVYEQYIGSIGILLGNGDGSFAGAVTHQSGSNKPGAICTGDLNKDGNLDLAFACGDLGTIGVQLGNGNGSFSKTITYASGGDDARSLVPGDFNKDGMQDLAASHMDGTVGILIGKGNGSFATPATTFETGGGESRSIVAADFNNDNILDVAVANRDNNIGILLGAGDGGFAPALTVATEFDYLTAIAATDLNKDGIKDIAVAYGYTSTIGVLIGKGDGGFATATAYESGDNYPAYIATADFNQDGNEDMATAALGGTIGLLLNTCGKAAKPVVVSNEKAGRTALISVTEGGGIQTTPNPFSAAAAIHFYVPHAGNTILAAYNQNGVEVARLFQGRAEGKKTYQASLAGAALPAGVYMLRLTVAGKQIAVSKIVRLQ